MHSPVTLILTFSLREKELRTAREVLPCSKLPLPKGEGWGEGQSVFTSISQFHA
jgi:hypothetical protein